MFYLFYFNVIVQLNILKKSTHSESLNKSCFNKVILSDVIENGKSLVLTFLTSSCNRKASTNAIVLNQFEINKTMRLATKTLNTFSLSLRRLMLWNNMTCLL